MDVLDTTVNAVVLAAIGLLMSIQTRRLEREMNRRFDQVDRRFEQVDRRFEAIEVRLDAMRSDLTTVALGARGPAAEAQ